jgi:hypothetical protein
MSGRFNFSKRGGKAQIMIGYDSRLHQSADVIEVNLASSRSHSRKQRRISEGDELKRVITSTEGGLAIRQWQGHFTNPVLQGSCPTQRPLRSVMRNQV